MKLFGGLLAGVLLITAVPASAQTLGELARREQERRKKAPAATKTYTNEDLKKLPPGPGSATDPAVKPADAKDAAKPAGTGQPGDPAKVDATKPPEPAKDEAYWRARIDAARENLRSNESFHEALQVQINALSADFAARDDPYQRAKVADDRQKKLAEQARVAQEIDKAKKQIAEIEDEARRAGVPPGWIR
jgi:hypothetical protein